MYSIFTKTDYCVIRKLFLRAFVALVIIFSLGKCYVDSSVRQFLDQSLILKKSELITIQHGATLQSVLFQLQEKKFISISWVTRFLHRLKPSYTQVKAGTYQLTDGERLKTVLKSIVLGREHQFSITFIEGSRFSDWLSILSSAQGIEHTMMHLSEKQIAEKLHIDKNKLEGLFLAETYHFPFGTKDIDILKRSHEKLEIVLKHSWNNRQDGLPLKRPYDALILASIIEKETAISSERKRVASVFVNRLKKGMRLQTDPTVIYGMGDKYDGNIRKKDLITPTKYNTYVIKGLPPTPIAMPGRKSIQAALQPEHTNYLYFVASGKGGHIFSKTLSEHNRAVRRYLKQLRQKK